MKRPSAGRGMDATGAEGRSGAVGQAVHSHKTATPTPNPLNMPMPVSLLNMTGHGDAAAPGGGGHEAECQSNPRRTKLNEGVHGQVPAARERPGSNLLNFLQLAVWDQRQGIRLPPHEWALVTTTEAGGGPFPGCLWWCRHVRHLRWSLPCGGSGRPLLYATRLASCYAQRSGDRECSEQMLNRRQLPSSHCPTAVGYYSNMTACMVTHFPFCFN